jgi:hypothetical protein
MIANPITKLSIIPLRSLIFLFLMGLFLSSCHYQFGHGELSQQYSTISVPYIEGDREGDFTAEVIKRIGTSGSFRYETTGGDLILSIKILDYENEDVGYRYDRKKHGEIKKVIIPTETRLKVTAEVIVKDACTGQIIRGPAVISTSMDFDHDFYFSRNEVNVFSLGQLNDIDAAQDAVMRPLYQSLAEKIVDYVTNSW